MTPRIPYNLPYTLCFRKEGQMWELDHFIPDVNEYGTIIGINYRFFRETHELAADYLDLSHTELIDQDEPLYWQGDNIFHPARRISTEDLFRQVIQTCVLSREERAR